MKGEKTGLLLRIKDPTSKTWSPGAALMINFQDNLLASQRPSSNSTKLFYLPVRYKKKASQ